MVILVCGLARRTCDRLACHPHLGQLVTPRDRNNVMMPIWAADNSAFAGFDAPEYLRMLAKIAVIPGCKWVTIPDVVADADSTMRLFDVWQPMVKELGLPVALVAQDGLEHMEVPWERFDCLFIGGSTGWKLSDQAADLMAAAKARGKWVHVGRAGTNKRMKRMHLAGADSIDSTCFSKWEDKHVPRGLRVIKALESIQPLFGPRAV